MRAPSKLLSKYERPAPSGEHPSQHISNGAGLGRWDHIATARSCTLHGKTPRGGPGDPVPGQSGGVLSPTAESLFLVDLCLEMLDETTFHWVLSAAGIVCQVSFP